MADETADGANQRDGATPTSEARLGDAAGAESNESGAPRSRASLAPSRRETLASLLGIGGLSLLSDPAGTVRGTVQSQTDTGGAVDPEFTYPVTLHNPDPDPFDTFGAAVGLSADATTVLVGAPRDAYFTPTEDGNFTAPEAGKAYVLTQTGEEWNTDSAVTLSNPSPEYRDLFGEAAALSADGNTALVGAPDQGDGVAYVFTRTADGWGVENPAVLPRPGFAVALSADATTALVGGGRRSQEGYVFARTGEGWNSEDPVTLSTPDSHSSVGGFDGAVALSGDGNTALVGTPGASTGPDREYIGAAYVFRRTSEG